MLRGRYGWLSQRNQFILPSPPRGHHPSLLDLLRSLSHLGTRQQRREKEGVHRILQYTREHTRARTYTERETTPPPGPSLADTHGHLRKRGTGLKCDRAERLIWFNGEFIWVARAIPHLLINRIASDRLPTRPPTTTV